MGALIAYNGKLSIHILTNKYTFYYATALTPEEHALVNCLQEQTPIDDGDTNWVMADDIFEGCEAMDISHTGGENDDLDDLYEGVNDTHCHQM